MFLKSENTTGITKSIELGFVYYQNSPRADINEDCLRTIFHRLCLEPKRIKKLTDGKFIIYKDIFLCYYYFNVIDVKIDYVYKNLFDEDDLLRKITNLKRDLDFLFSTIKKLE